jgi:hypothetical protein
MEMENSIKRLPRVHKILIDHHVCYIKPKTQQLENSIVFLYIANDGTREEVVTCNPRKEEYGEANGKGGDKGNK